MAGEMQITPQLSVIIPIYNDWEPLHGCLESLAGQKGAPRFEAIVVNDGSDTPAPESVHRFQRSFPLTLILQPHAGVAAARNKGIQNARGATLVFTDADCRLDSNCLTVVKDAMSRHPEQDYFQLRLAGDTSTLLGRAEDLRLAAIQEHLIQPEGHIRYLNTSGFAIRKSAIDTNGQLFDPAALRSEDTLLLVDLIRVGELPLFVSEAVVRHAVRMSASECIRKDVRVAWLEAETFQRISKEGVRIRMQNVQRVAMLRSLWRASKQPSIGRSAWFLLVARQTLQRSISVLYGYLPHPRSPRR